jgi:hypothetical protein
MEAMAMAVTRVIMGDSSAMKSVGVTHDRGKPHALGHVVAGPVAEGQAWKLMLAGEDRSPTLDRPQTQISRSALKGETGDPTS